LIIFIIAKVLPPMMLVVVNPAFNHPLKHPAIHELTSGRSFLENGSDAHFGRPGQELSRRTLRRAGEVTNSAEHQRHGKNSRRFNISSH
jgi:hypothetical protein